MAKISTLYATTLSKGAVPVGERTKLFPQTYVTLLNDMVVAVSQEVYRLAKSGLNVGKDVNENLAAFCNRMLSCINVEAV